jgi:two-component system, NarL family, sensor histidine kinase DevS
VTGGEHEGRRGEHVARQRGRDARAQATRIRSQSLRVTEALAVTEDQFAATIERLAESQPQHAERLRAMSRYVREQAANKRQRAQDRARISVATRPVQGGADGQPLPTPADTPGPAAVTATAMWNLVDAFDAGVAMTDQDGLIALASHRLGEIFGYERAELVGQPVEMLIPAAFRAAHRRHRSAYAQAPRIRLKDDRARLAGLRKDGTIIPVEISLSPVPSAGSRYTLAVVREAPEMWHREEFTELAWADAADRAHRRQEMELLGRIVNSLFQVGLSLRGADSPPGQLAQQRTAAALRHLDDVISDVRGHVFSLHGDDCWRHPEAPE